jgi:hypothetical protein
LAAHDIYYLGRLPHAKYADSPAELNALLADGKPTVVILPPSMPPEQLTAGALAIAPDRSFYVLSDLFTYPVLIFQGAEQQLHLGDLLHAMEWPANLRPIHP